MVAKQGSKSVATKKGEKGKGGKGESRLQKRRKSEGWERGGATQRL